MEARMDARRAALLSDVGRDAAIERSDFLVRAGQQLERFLSANSRRIRELGGLTLIDDDPDYLAVSPDGSFRSRTRVFDELTNEWHAETETIETAGELVELYNPADILQAFSDAQDGGASPEAGDEEAVDGGEPKADPWSGAADWWAAGQTAPPQAHDTASAAEALYDLALDYQERSQRAESGLLEGFEHAASDLLSRVGTLTIVEDEDEQLTVGVAGFRGKVVPEGESHWQDLAGPEAIVRYYDPTDVFGDLAEAIAEAYPDVTSEPDEPDDGQP
jgi:hypothetical protein